MSASLPPWTVPSHLRDLARHRIWDCYGSLQLPPSLGSSSRRVPMEEAAAEMIKHLDHYGIERLAPLLQVGMGTRIGATSPAAEETLRCLQRWPDRLIGIATLNAKNVAGCLENLDRWVKDGPMAGVFFTSSSESLVCNHPNFDPIVRRAHELGAVILQHTWYKTGGKESVGESTPAELAELARRHPDIPFVCVHSGGEWEKGIRAVRGSPNIIVETSGFDPTAGFVEMAVRELGASRVIYGGHYPGRSFGTELSKVLAADISDADRFLIFGENFRRLLKPLFQKKGRSLT